MCLVPAKPVNNDFQIIQDESPACNYMLQPSYPSLVITFANANEPEKLTELRISSANTKSAGVDLSLPGSKSLQKELG